MRPFRWSVTLNHKDTVCESESVRQIIFVILRSRLKCVSRNSWMYECSLIGNWSSVYAPYKFSYLHFYSQPQCLLRISIAFCTLLPCLINYRTPPPSDPPLEPSWSLGTYTIAVLPYPPQPSLTVPLISDPLWASWPAWPWSSGSTRTGSSSSSLDISSRASCWLSRYGAYFPVPDCPNFRIWFWFPVSCSGFWSPALAPGFLVPRTVQTWLNTNHHDPI